MKKLNNRHFIYFTDKEGVPSHLNKEGVNVTVEATGCAPQYRVGQDICFGNSVDDKYRIVKINHRLQHSLVFDSEFNAEFEGPTDEESNIFKTEIVVNKQ
jgi:hypothetical protein